MPLWCKWISLFHQEKWRQGHRRHSGQCFIKCKHLMYKFSWHLPQKDRKGLVCMAGKMRLELLSAVVKEKTMPPKAGLRTASSLWEPTIWGPGGTSLCVSWYSDILCSACALSTCWWTNHLESCYFYKNNIYCFYNNLQKLCWTTVSFHQQLVIT